MDDKNNLWMDGNYSAPVQYIIDSIIMEYDIIMANISILRDANAINELQYNSLAELPKQEREVTVGKMIRDNPEFSVILKRGITEARKSLFEFLGLSTLNVLAIRNDAVYVIGDPLKDYPDFIRVTMHTVFAKKNVYRSFYKINKKEFYYSYDNATAKEGIDVKGLGDHAIQAHKDYLIAKFMDIFYSAVVLGPKAAYTEACNLYNDYIKMKLPLDFYRRMDSFARFDLKIKTDNGTFQADYLTAGYAEDNINIAYNERIINALTQFYLAEIFKQR